MSADFAQVRAAEQAWLQVRRQAAGTDPDAPPLGLAFSGGGIRSACFHLGFLEALGERDLLRQVDYLSSVSGGGYIASCFQWLKHQTPEAADADLFRQQINGTRVINWLRAHASYLTAGKGVNSMTLFAALLASSLFNLLLVLPVLLAALWLFGLPHTHLAWPAGWHLAGASQIEGHAGYLLALLMAALLAALYVLAIPTMAFWRQSSQRHNFAPRRWMGWLLGAALVCGLIGSLPLVAQLGDLLVLLADQETAASLGKHLSYLLPLAGGITALRLGSLKPKLALAGLTLLLYGIAALGYHLVFHRHWPEQPAFWLWLAGALGLAAFASINRTSMHSYYLARLCNGFFPAAGDNQSAGDMPLCALGPAHGAALPLINTTLSTRNSRQPSLRNRLGTSFTLSPLYCGAPATGYAPSGEFQSGRMTLGEAMTTSGAAVDPATAQTANRSLSFLMALLNFRLGFWTRAPRAASQRFSRMPYWLIGREMFGAGLSERHRHIHLSDGGHFENLGVYELLRRELPVIIAGDAGDAGADPATQLTDLRNLIQRALADFDCTIQIDVSPLLQQDGKEHASCFAIGQIHYASGKTGQLVYVKSLLTAGCPALLKSFARTDSAFPNDNTADQFFDEIHFDAYRLLGKFNLQQALAAHPDLLGKSPRQQPAS